MTSKSTSNIELLIECGHDIRTKHWNTPKIKELRYQVDIRINNESSRTGIARVLAAQSPRWNHKLTCNVSGNDRVILELYCTHPHRKTHRVCCSKEIDILALEPSREHRICLYNEKNKENGTVAIWYQEPDQAQDANSAIKPYPLDRLKDLGIITSSLASSKVGMMPPAWTNILFSLGTLIQISNYTAQIYPKAHFAVTTVTFAFEIAIQQCLRDQKVNGLLDAIATNYRLILVSGSLERIQSCKTTIERMLDATKECALFIVEYCKTQGFAGRAIQNVISKTDMVLDSFEKAFTNLKIEFLTNGVTQVAIRTVRILESVEHIASDVRDINAAVNLPMHETSWDPQSVCLPDSPNVTLNDIARWAICRDPEAPIFLLVGPPGCGKTRIANSTAFAFDSGRRLGASVFLDRGVAEHRNPTKVFSSIARELAAFDDQLRLRISKAISLRPSLGTAFLERQLQGLIIEPLSDLTIIGPILVIIDGLDVWQDRKRVLSALRNASNLHPNLRILITSRPETDIVNSLKGFRHCHHRFMTPDEYLFSSSSLGRLKDLGIITSSLASSKVGMMPPAWTNILFSLGTLIKISNNIAQIYPKARLAVTTVTFALEIAIQQRLRDQRVTSLLDAIAANYRLILDSQPLERIQSCKTTIERMLDVTKECAMYIVEYCKTQNFIVRAIQNVISTTDMVLDSFEKAFADLRMEFLTNGVAQAAIGTIRIMESVEDIASDVRDINAAVNLPMHETSWNPQSVCLPGSQKQILNDIARWVIRRDPEAPIFLLVGPPGCGKTRIANSTAFTFDDGGHLGASVFLDRGIAEHRIPTKVFSSIARELAAFDNQLKLRISKAISLKPCLGTAVPERQLQGLIIEPLSDLTIIGPILVIIDGLDVWQDRKRVLSALRNASNLHPNLRFLITSRPEADIVNGLKGIPHCHQRRMTADEEGLVEDVTSYSRQCLEILQDNRPSIFADYSVEEVFDDFEAKSLGIYLWRSVAIRFLTVVSNDTARAFLSIICSVEAPPDYAIAMSILKCSIHDSLKAISQVKLKSEISVGAAMALGVTGLWSDKAPQILNIMLEKQLLQHDDNASRFLSSMLHPWSTEGMTSNRQCSHPVVESGSVASNVCMAHVCVTFLCDRLSSDICSDIYVTKNDGEDVIDARLWKRSPHHLRPYVAEAYGYATKFWIDHLKDVQDDCCIPFLEQKLRNLIEHIFHLHEYMGKDGRQTAEVLRKFLDIFEASELLGDPWILSQARSLLNRFKISPHGCDRARDRPRRKRSVRRSLSQNLCFCPLYRTWKITSPNICTLKACLEYAGKPTTLRQCLMVTPAIVPMIDEGGRICRTIGEVTLTVDRTASDDEQYPCASDNMRIGVAIIQKPCDEFSPEWAGTLPSPVPQDSPIDMMGEPWLWPLPGDKASVVVDWEELGLEEYLYPLQAGDQLAIVAEFLPMELQLAAKFSVTLDIEYELEHHNDEK